MTAEVIVWREADGSIQDLAGCTGFVVGVIIKEELEWEEKNMSAEVDWRRCIPGGGGVGPLLSRVPIAPFDLTVHAHVNAPSNLSHFHSHVPAGCTVRSKAICRRPCRPVASVGDPDGLLAAERGGAAWWLLFLAVVTRSQHYRIPVLIDWPHHLLPHLALHRLSAIRK